ncbi:WD40 repeat-like protein [Crucibulum laeve]|uniref:WD40 repeat-like protein n=1 Tax=Crucibulum laeve TaxID=68775 RepID=A0A5C3MG27_9AGAR|nr:WD40 repeat-like protein [Crucibulum laeve]
MRARHTPHSLPSFPVYSSAFLSENQLVLGGGGGASKTGIKNKLRLYDVDGQRNIDLKAEFELERGEDAPMSMAAHTQGSTLICGVNSTLEQLEKGENENCRVFSVRDNNINLLEKCNTLPAGDLEDYQKVTILSPDGTLLAVAGAHHLTLLSYPSLTPVANPIETPKEIYDATFSATSLVIATTMNLLVYALPNIEKTSTTSPKKGKGKNKLGGGSSEKIGTLELKETVGLPSMTGGSAGSTFRAARFHPTNKVLYTVINTSPPRTKKSKSSARQAYICKWNTESWNMEKSRRVGDRGLTCFNISADGRFLGYGSSDLAIGMLDAKTLNPLVTILKAHEFPPTTITFNPTTTLLVSGSADNSIRIVSVPQIAGSPSWSLILLILLTLMIAFFAFVLQNYISMDTIKW